MEQSSLRRAATALDRNAIDEFECIFEGILLEPESSSYRARYATRYIDAAPTPGLAALCFTIHDVVQCIWFARAYRLPIIVKRQDTIIAGQAADGGLLVDLSVMRTVTVDRVRGIVDVQAGATVADLDLATGACGLVVPAATRWPRDAIAGLVLASGVGWLGRGLSPHADVLLGITVVTMDGVTRNINPARDPQLVMALFTAEGDTGIVISIRLKAEPMGMIVMPKAHLKYVDPEKLLKLYRVAMGTPCDAAIADLFLEQ
ncbi:FAD-binding oxidoreductase [Rhizobium leguminosarum]|uniref:FAD-binding oxidoreductase n=1 Tax=Rhizobium TaxID=379 RepID=UPI001030DF5D|nr:FAD-binding protein [Rhizobium leguminosarum]TBF87877.1 FAD-binding oxidoreductase [Rhizobium leguminosarum]TBG07142.1 FAD-binding oxidoreductase [Rhizobium leguminosarum]TBG07706.1 FAD-binding oxidoreductase [Rhizobium leguminosarum]TBG30826.1 FAD-binding oxidoreductase [Rhizobium leguminosarum]TBG50072.1 FAD-binding oxidoreductase [Rhizobium leguminosarum]